MIHAERAQRDGFVVGIPLENSDLQKLARAVEILRADQHNVQATDSELLAKLLLSGACAAIANYRSV